MEKIIFFGLVIPIMAYVLYLGGMAIMNGFKSKEANRAEKEEAESETSEIRETDTEQSINLSDEFTKLINELEKGGDKDSQYENISYTSEQYSESISRLYLHYANLKIDKLIKEFESSKNKDFSLLQSVEDIKKKIEIYQSTL